MQVINEIQTGSYYTQEFSAAHLRVLVNLGVIVHVQTLVYDNYVHRFFSTPEDAHDYRVVDGRSTFFGCKTLAPVAPEYTEQWVPESKYDLSDYVLQDVVVTDIDPVGALK